MSKCSTCKHDKYKVIVHKGGKTEYPCAGNLCLDSDYSNYEPINVGAEGHVDHGNGYEQNLMADICDAYVFLRRHNHSIPDNSLDFMKDAALSAVGKPETDEGLKEHERLLKIESAAKEWAENPITKNEFALKAALNNTPEG